ncbi:MAG: DUF3303 family protein [Saprospiraceae bacterium]|nr:DUF3303 family protein [Saprospiraceae bacterium]
MTFLVIEKFNKDKIKLLYQRLEKEGRLMPEGIEYISSWIDIDITTCYQIVKGANIGQIQEWLTRWAGFAEFEIIPVIDSATASKIVLSEESQELKFC